jgi:hypothetical protein
MAEVVRVFLLPYTLGSFTYAQLTLDSRVLIVNLNRQWHARNALVRAGKSKIEGKADSGDNVQPQGALLLSENQ